MAGVGFDAAMIRGADDLKERIGRAGVRLERVAQPARGGLRGGDRRRRDGVVRGPRDVHPARQRRRAVRRRRGVPGRAARRRPARARRGHGRGRRAVGADARPHGRGRSGALAVRPRDEGGGREGEARPQGPLRAGRRGPHEDQGVRGRRGAGRAAALRPAATRRGRSDMESASTRRAPVRKAEAQGERVSRRPEFEWLARAGLVARGVVYGIIGLLAIKLALGDGGKTADQQGALHTIAGQPFGKVLLDPRGHRPGRLRALAARPRGASATGPRAARTTPRTASAAWSAGSPTGRSASRRSRSSPARAAAAGRRAIPTRRRAACWTGQAARCSSASSAW